MDLARAIASTSRLLIARHISTYETEPKYTIIKKISVSSGLDAVEPEHILYDIDIYRYHPIPNLRVGTSYHLRYSQVSDKNMEEADQEQAFNRVRCAWAGSQKYGALLWSGDAASSR
jgi:alpha-glucosidase (family GH31 glycosyl hydrolase)